MEDEDEEGGGDDGPDVPPHTMAMLLGNEDLIQGPNQPIIHNYFDILFTVDNFAEMTSSVTETLLGMIPPDTISNGSNRQSNSINSPTKSNEHIPSEFSISSSPFSHSRQQNPPLAREIPMKMIRPAANNNDNSNIATIQKVGEEGGFIKIIIINFKIFLRADNNIQQCRGPTNGVDFGRKRKAEDGEGTSNSNKIVEDPEKRLKQLKCEFLEVNATKNWVN